MVTEYKKGEIVCPESLKAIVTQLALHLSNLATRVANSALLYKLEYLPAFVTKYNIKEYVV